MVNRSLYDQQPIVFRLRLALGAAILAVLLTKVILRGGVTEFPITFGGNVLLLISYGLLAWPALRQQAVTQGRKWRILPGGWRFMAVGIVLAVFFLVNAYYLLHLPFALEPHTYQQTTDGRFVRVGTGYSKDATVQWTLNGLQQGCLLCGAYTPTTPAEPLENLTSAEDLGLAFFFGRTVLAGWLPPTLDGYQHFIVFAILTGILLAAGVVGYVYRSVTAPMVWVAAIFSSHTLTPHPPLALTTLQRTYWVSAWVAVLAAAWALAILATFGRGQKGGWFGYSCLAALGLTVGIGMLCRSEAGYIALIFGVSLLAFCSFRQRNWGTRLLLWIIFAGGVALPVAAFRLTLESRTAWYQLPPPYPESFTSHGIWHNAFIGLGYVSNRWGIEWDDTNGWQYAQEHCPGVQFASEQYFVCLQGGFFKILRADPGLLLRNLAAKSIGIFRAMHWQLAIGVSMTIIFFSWRAPLVFLLLLMFLFALPSLLTRPEYHYLLGFFGAIVVLGTVSVLEFVGIPSNEVPMAQPQHT